MHVSMSVRRKGGKHKLRRVLPHRCMKRVVSSQVLSYVLEISRVAYSMAHLRESCQ
jgi:hypothetical protein